MYRYWTKEHYWIRFQMWFTPRGMNPERWHSHFCWIPIVMRNYHSDDWWLPNQIYKDTRCWLTWVERRWVKSMEAGYWQYRPINQSTVPWEEELGPRGERYDSF